MSVAVVLLSCGGGATRGCAEQSAQRADSLLVTAAACHNVYILHEGISKASEVGGRIEVELCGFVARKERGKSALGQWAPTFMSSVTK